VLTWLLVPLRESMSFFNLFRYITFRTALAGITAMLISFLFGSVLIRFLRKRQIGQEVRQNGPKSHLAKQGTPSMGGILIIGSTIIPTLLWGNLGNSYVWLGMSTMILFGLIGFLDDYLKISKKRSAGLIVRNKLILQTLLAAGLACVVILVGLSRGPATGFDLKLYLPFLKTWTPFLGWAYLPWIMFILVSSSNAVNLADGLDGLAIGLTLISAPSISTSAACPRRPS
jgi:phospho-N-acetylmuramoyl-pentapeptide-transferase